MTPYRRMRHPRPPVVIPADWEIEFAHRNGRYEIHTHTHRMVDALRAFTELEVRDGEKKRLLRNGRVIERVAAPREIHTAIGEQLPIAL